MDKVKEWVKAHPKLTVAFIVGIVVLIYLIRRNSASSAAQSATVAGGLTSSDYVSLQSAELQAASQVQAQSIARDYQMAQLQAQLQATQVNDQTQLSIAQLQQQLGLAQVYATQGVQTQTVAAQKDVAIATINSNTQANADQASIELGLINILAGKGNILSPSPSTVGTPSVVSSITVPPAATVGSSPSGAVDATGAVLGGGAPGTTQEFRGAAPATVGFVDTHPLVGVIAPGAGLPTGYSEISGVGYGTNPNAPYAPDYTYASESAAIQAGALVLNASGQYVPANPGLQITY